MERYNPGRKFAARHIRHRERGHHLKGIAFSLSGEFQDFPRVASREAQAEAANKLLKIIEEPFDDTLFILVSNDDSRLLPTIFSRTQRFIMRPLDHAEISAHLRSHTG